MGLRIDGPRLVIVKNKHEPDYFLITSVPELIDVLRMLAKQRLKEGYWYEDNSDGQQDLFTNTDSPKEKITAILASERSKQSDAALYHFMQDRRGNGYEYEGWELENFSKVNET